MPVTRIGRLANFGGKVAVCPHAASPALARQPRPSGAGPPQGHRRACMEVGDGGDQRGPVETVGACLSRS